VPTGIKINSNTFKRPFSITVFMMLMLLCFSYIFAAGYDFDKLGALARQRYGEEARQDIEDLQLLVSQLKTAPDAEKLRKINDFFNNKMLFAEDIEIWGQSDYWSTPLESIGRQAGDCEDFSIAKYMFLKAANIPNNKLRLTYVKARLNNGGQKSVRAHMVLSYYSTPQAEPLILDSLVPGIYPASERKDLSPIFSFNDKGIWVGSNPNPKDDAQSHLSKWRDVLLRMQMEGLE